jgi:uncharacterized protein (DUF2235 family)
MPKNILIFSDGTGQAGGRAPDENISNIYKLFRATRCGPESDIDPLVQLTFYDPGLGSQPDGGIFFAERAYRWIHNVVSQATGLGITLNIIDCYAAILQMWQPGDRIFLFGFSRGAYTVRCVAAVLSLCGVPPPWLTVPLPFSATRDPRAELRRKLSRKCTSMSVRPEIRLT